MSVRGMFSSFKEIRGNARFCIYTEPLNGIPYNLYMPYTSVYMLALGLSDARIGLVVTINWISQLLMAIFSGVITDKLGRRLTTLIFDLTSYAIPAVISALAQDIRYFLAAAVISGTFRIVQNSWNCLLVEDTPPEQLLDVFAWINIAFLCSVYFVPLAGLLVKELSLVPAVRILYWFAAVSFTLKSVLTYLLTVETRQGVRRMQETRHTSLFSSLKEYRQVISEVFKSRATLYTAGIMIVMSISEMLNNTFWSVLVTQKVHIPDEHISMFPFVKSLLMMAFFFFVVPRLKFLHFKLPMFLAFISFALGQLLLVLVPEKNYILLFISIILEAGGAAVLYPLVNRLTVLTIDPKERARIQSLLYVGVILVTAPFGWAGGLLSTLNKGYPFILNFCLLSLGAFLAWRAGREERALEV